MSNYEEELRHHAVYCAEHLRRYEPHTAEYTTILHNLIDIVSALPTTWWVDKPEEARGEVGATTTEPCEWIKEDPCEKSVEKCEESTEKSPEKCAEAVVYPKVEDTHEATDSEEPLPSPAEMRAILADARREGVDVTSILHSLGCKYLSELPDEKYRDMLAKVEEAKHAG